jgi:hypothetical protein
MRMEIRFFDSDGEFEIIHVDSTRQAHINAVTFAQSLGAAGYSYKEVLEALEHALLVLEDEALEAADYIDREDQE